MRRAKSCLMLCWRQRSMGRHTSHSARMNNSNCGRTPKSATKRGSSEIWHRILYRLPICCIFGMAYKLFTPWPSSPNRATVSKRGSSILSSALGPLALLVHCYQSMRERGAELLEGLCSHVSNLRILVSQGSIAKTPWSTLGERGVCFEPTTFFWPACL